MIRTLIFFCSLSLLSCTNCKDKNCPDDLLYRLPVSFSPEKDTFSIGDTIRVKLEFSDEMVDEKGNIPNTFENFDFRLEVGCDQMDIDPPVGDILSVLGIQTLIGKHNAVGLPSGISFYEITPAYKDKKYSYECVLTVKKRGLFSFGVSPFEWRGEDFDLPNGKCSHVPLHFDMRMNEGRDNNYHMFKDALNSVYHRIEQKDANGYCFYVK